MSIDMEASTFASVHGSFALLFDADDNYGGREPYPLPWALMLDSDESRAWGGHTALEAIENAALALANE